MKKIDYERGLVRMAWALGILGGIGLSLFLLPYLPPQLSLTIASPFFIMIFLLAFIALNPAGKLILVFLGITIVFLMVRFFIKGFHPQYLTEQQEISKIKISRRIVVSALIVVLVGFGGSGYLIYSWYWQTHTGSRSGQVIDGVTGKPVEGAVVNYAWKLSGFMTMGGAIGASYETVTDKNGIYLIPNQRVSYALASRRILFINSLEREEVLVYKDKYAGYELYRQYKKPPIGRSFGYLDIKQPYCENNNIVKLYPFKEGESHENHLDWIGMHSPERNKLLLKELEPERKRAYK